MTTLEMQPTTLHDQRRSQRIVLRVGITILGTSLSGQVIHEKAHTLVVNAHGAYLPLESIVEVGQVLTVRHNKTEEELFCRVARIDRNSDGKINVAIEFLQPASRFWRVTFPPADWKPANLEPVEVRGPRYVSAPISHAA
jgi:hypothetical protein